MGTGTTNHVFRYGSAVLIIALATILRLLLDPFLQDRFPFITFFFGLVLVAWMSGLGPSLAALFLSCLSAAYFILPPRGTLLVQGQDNQIGLGIFFLAGLAVALLSGSLRSAQQSALRAQEAERDQRQQWQVTLRSIGDAVIATDHRGGVTFFNPVAESLTGWSLAEARQEPLDKVFRILNEQTRQPVEDPVARVLRDGRVVGLGNHTILIAKDGSEKPIDDSAAPILDPNNKISGVVLVFRDVTERRRLEKLQRNLQDELERQVQERTAELQVSEERFRLLVEGTKDYAIFMLDPRGHVTSWNPGAERIKGYRAEEIIGQHFSRFYQPEEIQRGKPDQELQVALAAGKYEEEGWRLRKDGTRFWASVLITALRDEHGNPRGFSKITRDRTEKKEVEEALRKSYAALGIRAQEQSVDLAEAMQKLQEEISRRQKAEENLAVEHERLRVTLTSIGDAVIATDKEGRVSFLNPVAESLTGWALAEANQTPLSTVFRIINEQTRQTVEDPVARVLRDGKVVGLGNHTILIARDGSEKPIDDSAAPILDQNNKISGVVLVFRDVTERRRAEQVLRESEERLRLFIENSPAALAMFDREMRYLAVSSRWLADYKINDPNIIGKSHYDLFPEIPDRWREVHQRALQGEIVKADEDHFERLDGAVQWLKWEVRPWHTGKGEIGGIIMLAEEITARKQAEERVRQSEEQTRRTLEFNHTVTSNMGEGLYAVDTQGLVTYMNPAAEAMFGWTFEELNGRKMHEMTHHHHPDGRPFPIEECAGFQVMHEGKTLRDHDDMFIRKDGTFFPVRYSSSPLRSDGKIVGLVVVFRDVTARKRAEWAVRDSEARKTAILETALDCIITMDHQGNVIEFNPAAERTFGYRRADIIGKPLADFIIPASLREQHYHGLARYMATGDPPILNKRIEMPALRADGTEFPVELSITRIPTGETPVFTAHVRDISDRKQLEHGLRQRVEQLASAQERVNSVINHVIDGIITIDEHGIIATFNPAAERIFGYTASEVIGQNVKMLMPEPFHGEHDEYLAHYLGTGEAKIIGIGREVAGRRRDGSIFPLDLAVSEFSLGSRRFFSGIVRDITERKRLEQELRQRVVELAEADRRKNEFLAILSHELRNPLAPIRTAVELLRRKGSTEADLRWGTDVIDRQSQQLGRLVHDLLDLSRISRGQIALYKDCIPISAIVKQALETSQPNIDANEHELTVTLPKEPLFVEGDLTRLSQVVANLVNNAAKYTRRGGHIWLSAERLTPHLEGNPNGESDNGQVVLRVRDNGIGIPAEMLSNIFDMFTQVDTSLERKTGGLGIGLTLSRQLIELHGGNIEAHSAGLGQGSEFIVRLPLAKAPAAQPDALQKADVEERGAPSSSAPRRRILVVDDNIDAAESFAKLLQLGGHEVRMAHDGLEGVNLADAFRPDVVLLDIGLPKLNGFDAARRIREQPWGKNMTIIALTGWGQEEDQQRSKEAGFDYHLVKPVKAATLNGLLAGMQPNAFPPTID